ncbi:hypothetical protein M5D96_004671 [Drosophila gunungcola]|uniref:Serpin domain-containing protein n=2 Tax=Drosophila gunungcola TaxID=103775 RepID=A0A9Q0BSV2_9MUSC|nr:hypothetical protein M5D96_004671 [Drosophila gunungcola]
MSVAGQFVSDFYKRFAKDNLDKNICISPFSVEILMHMVYMGAGGKTAQELRKILKPPPNESQVAPRFKDILTNLEVNENEVILANRIYVNDEYQLVSGYNELVKDSFKAEAQTINLKNSDNAASVVNKWAIEVSSGRIRNIVSPNDMKPDLKVALLSAIYFKPEWLYKFNPKDTYIADFHVTAQKRIPVEMMRMSGNFGVKITFRLNAQYIYLPLRNSNLTMVIFLPLEVDGLEKVEKRISTYFFRTIHKEYVDLRLPKFKIEFSADVKNILGKMGIRDAFESSADLSGLVKPSKAPINKVFQKASFEVDEEGDDEDTPPIEEYNKCAGCGQWEFIAEHPFAYLIRDQHTTYIQGHVVNPGT